MNPELVDLAQALNALGAKLAVEVADWQRAHKATVPESGKDLLRIVQAVAEQTRKRAETLVANSGPSIEHESIRTIIEAAKTVYYLNDLLEHGTKRLLHPVLSPTLRTLKSTLGLTGDVFVSVTGELSYEVETLRSEHFDDLVGRDGLSGISWPIRVFKVPERPLDWALYHVLLLHEVGHAVIDERHGELEVDVRPSPGLLAEEEAAKGDLVREMNFRSREAAFFSAASRWLEEVCSDAVGILLVGPAYALAACRVLGFDASLECGTSTHPPAALRLLLMLRTLKEQGLLVGLPPRGTEVLDGWSARLEALHTADGYTAALDPKSATLDGQVGQVSEAVAESYKQAVLKMKNIIGSHVCTPDTIKSDVERADEYRKTGVPPIELEMPPSLKKIGQPLDISRIFSVMWMAYLREIEQGLVPIAKHEQLANALLEALDAAEALRAWVAAG